MAKEKRDRSITPKEGRVRTDTLRKRTKGLAKKIQDLNKLTGVSIALCLYDHNKDEIKIESFGRLEKLKEMETFRKILIKLCKTKIQV